MSYSLGIDFGTTFTAAAVARDGAVHLATLGDRAGAVPAAVFIHPDGTLLHGEDALLRGAADPLRLVRNLKRTLGDTAVLVVDGERHETAALVADHLRWALRRVEAQEGGPPRRLVLTHPASWRSSRLERLQLAIEMAGIDPHLLTEPHAAAAFHAEAFPLKVGDLVAAYDLGGGTFDAAVLRRTRHGFELAGEPEGQPHLGGLDFDAVVLHLVQSRLGQAWKSAESSGGRSFDIAMAGLRQECVSAKECLSDEFEVDVPVLLPGIATHVTISRRDLDHLLRPSIDETIGSFRRAVSGAGATMSDLTAVLMVGGSCQLPIVRDALRSAVGDAAELLDADPRHAVARGAAMEAAELLDLEAPPPPLQPQTQPEPEPEPSSAVTAPTPAHPTLTAPEAFELPSPTWSPPKEMAVGLTADVNRRRRWVSPAMLAAIALIMLAVPVGLILLLRDRDLATDVGSPTTDSLTSTAESAAGLDESTREDIAQIEVGAASAHGMVQIPAGIYTVGVDEPGLESVAVFTTEVASFSIDQYEITNAQYLAFVQQIGAPPPLSWERGVSPEGQEDHPVSGVEYVWADAYCGALQKRLPTEAEWEVAARGPDGSLFPPGETAESLGLETSGSRPVGSNTANVSGFGVFDSVGSVWEWVDTPYVETDPIMAVRRGGQYGRVRDGAAMRQVVDPNGQATISETGFRCAADDVDPTVEPLVFDVEHERPLDDDAGADVAGPIDGSVLVNDSFDDTGSGFVEVDEGTWRVGYHAPSWYHLEATQAKGQIMSLGGYNLADGDVQLAVSIDKLGTETGQYRYGLVFRAGGELERPPVGLIGPPRPSVYYAFVINPRAGVWELLHEDELPQRVQATGPLPTVTVQDATAPDVLGVNMNGATVTLSVNDERVATFDTRGFHVEAGNLGLYAETFDETLVHAHFDLLTVDAVTPTG